MIKRDEERWAKMETDSKREQERLEALVGTDKRNQSSVAYDPLTLQYRDSGKAAQLKYEDEMVKVRPKCSLCLLSSVVFHSSLSFRTCSVDRCASACLPDDVVSIDPKCGQQR